MNYLEFRNKYNGKCVDYDGSFGGQCWDLAQQYFTECLGVPAYVLGGVGLVNNMLVEPKLSQLLQFFDEVPIINMIQGDTVIWEYGHIAIFDNWDGTNCWYFTQNDGSAENPSGNAHIGLCPQASARAFRLKGYKPVEPTTQDIKVGSKVKIGTIAPYKYYIADDVQIKYGIYQIRENVNAGGENAFEWRDNGIPEACVDLVDENGNKLPNSDYTHTKKGDKFIFAKTFEVKKIAYDNNKKYFYLDFDGNADNRFWVIEDYCYLV